MTVAGNAALPARPWRRRLGSVALPALALGGVVVLVWWLTAAVVDSTVLPNPANAVSRLAANLATQRFQTSTLNTLVRLVISYALVVGIGAAVGFAIGMSRFWSDAASPVMYALYSIPKIVLVPLFLLFLGLGDLSQIGFAVFSGVIPMVLMVMTATAGVPRVPLKLAASLRMTTPQVVLKIVLPSTLPSLASAARLTFSLTFLGLLICEMFSGVRGLGYELLRNVPLARIGDIVGEVLLIMILAIGPTAALRALERRVHLRFGGAVNETLAEA